MRVKYYIVASLVLSLFFSWSVPVFAQTPYLRGVNIKLSEWQSQSNENHTIAYGDELNGVLSYELQSTYEGVYLKEITIGYRSSDSKYNDIDQIFYSGYTSSSFWLAKPTDVSKGVDHFTLQYTISSTTLATSSDLPTKGSLGHIIMVNITSPEEGGQVGDKFMLYVKEVKVMYKGKEYLVKIPKEMHGGINTIISAS